MGGEGSSDAGLERTTVAERVGKVHEGAGGALVLRGEPGIGRTTLLDYAVASARDMSVSRFTGVERETHLSFSALHVLAAPLLALSGSLPEDQQAALSTALAGDTSANLFLTGLALIALMIEAAAVRPVLWAVDDLQWLDRESVDLLAFIARRLKDERIMIILAVREPTEAWIGLHDLPELWLARLQRDAAFRLLARTLTLPLDDRVREQIVAAGHGNPLALIEIASALTPDELSGRRPLPDSLREVCTIERSFAERVSRLPASTRSLLLLCAAERAGDGEVLARSARALGLETGALRPAVEAGLVVEAPVPRFRHPLIAPVVYASAGKAELRRVHSALADATDPDRDPDGHVGHRAAAAAGPDEPLASELSQSALRVQSRAGFRAAAPLFARAVQLTGDPSRRAERVLAAARAAQAAGKSQGAAVLLRALDEKTLGSAQRADMQRLVRCVDYELGYPVPGRDDLVAAARELEAVDVGKAREVHLEALVQALYASRFNPDGVREAVADARAAPPADPRRVSPGDLLLDGFTLLFGEGHAAAAPTLRLAVAALREHDDIALLLLGGHAATELLDDESLGVLANRSVQIARATGSVALLPRALNFLAGAYELTVGNLDAAESHLREAREIRSQIAPLLLDRLEPTRALVEAWRGNGAETDALARATTVRAAQRGQGVEIAAVDSARAVFNVGRGDYQAALAAARAATAYDTLHVVTTTLPELVEAAVRCGEWELAAAAAQRFAARARASGSHWALGMLARAHALIAEADEADELYRDAIGHLERCRAVPQLARANLVYGEWLRRHRRRREARRQLRLAYEIFVSVGAVGFAERTRCELNATGERLEKRTRAGIGQLTAHETRIAHRASEGSTNAEIAVEFVISPRTVEYHLHKVYRKLGIMSRVQLARALSDVGPTPRVT